MEKRTEKHPTCLLYNNNNALPWRPPSLSLALYCALSPSPPPLRFLWWRSLFEIRKFERVGPNDHPPPAGHPRSPAPSFLRMVTGPSGGPHSQAPGLQPVAGGPELPFGAAGWRLVREGLWKPSLLLCLCLPGLPCFPLCCCAPPPMLLLLFFSAVSTPSFRFSERPCCC